ncbi:MAG: hypothetical protein HRU05_05695 [Oceanospirillaceae bacterium]|nr:hypothetical protein [Oceanospirillaceae bacterium]
MLPMGTIMALSMLLAVIINTDLVLFRLIKKLPTIMLNIVAIIVLCSGLWNVLWYAAQHLGEFWGNAALGSGLLMIISSGYALVPLKLPRWLNSVKPVVLLLLLGFFLLYAVTIYQL